MTTEKIRFKHYTPKPGHPDIDECLAEAKALAAKIAPVITKDADLTVTDRLADKKRRAKALLKVGENFIVNRKRLKEGNNNLRPLYAIWTMLNACNFGCTYCDNHQGRHYFDIKDPDRLDTEQGKKLLDVIATGTSAIYWCGGEPTLRNDLPELLNHGWDLGFFPNLINTNGSMIAKRLVDPAWKDFLRQMDIIIVSLDALDLAKLKKLWAVDSGRQVIVNLLLLRELQKVVSFKLAVNAVITPDTLEEARSVFDLACDLGIWFAPVPVNFKDRPDASMLSDPRYKELADLIIERKKKGVKIIGSQHILENLLWAKDYKCQTTLKPHIWSNGSICYPCRASHNVKPVDINLLDYHSFDEAYDAGRKLINPDNFHGMAVNQCGGDCAWMQNYTTARYVEGVTDPLGSGFFDEIREFAFNKNL